jgi:hypothetical protein
MNKTQSSDANIFQAAFRCRCRRRHRAAPAEFNRNATKRTMGKTSRRDFTEQIETISNDDER